MFWALLGIALAILLYYAFVKPFNYWKDLGIDQYPFWITLRETLLAFIQYRSFIESIQKTYGDYPGKRYIGIYQLNRPLLVLKDPDLIKQITVKDFEYFLDHISLVPDNLEPLWEKNLFALKGEKWRDMRSTLSPSFTSSKMKIMFGVISDCAKQFVSYFEEQNSNIVTVEMKDIFTKFTNDVIASSAFGVTCDSIRNQNNDFYLMGKELVTFKGFWKNIRFLCMMLLPKVGKILGFSFFDKKASHFFRQLVEDNVRIREKEGIVRQDMIHLLMEARKERSKNEKILEDDVDVSFAAAEDFTEVKQSVRRKEQITDEDIIAQALIFFFAGFESVSTLMCFMAYELAVNPEIQERLQNEVDDTLTDCGGSLTYDALSKMKYMDMVVSESLRKWPTAVATDRVCVKPYTITPLRDGEQPVHLRKGDAVWIPTYGFHRDPQLYPEPDRFDPERFSDENKSSIVPYTYLPFGAGPRNCIGNRFALMETKLVFFHILSKFNIAVVEKTPVPLKLDKRSFQLNAEGGFWLGLKARRTDP